MIQPFFILLASFFLTLLFSGSVSTVRASFQFLELIIYGSSLEPLHTLSFFQNVFNFPFHQITHYIYFFLLLSQSSFSERSFPECPHLVKFSRYGLSYYLVPSLPSTYDLNFTFICVIICCLHQAKTSRKVETTLMVLTIRFPVSSMVFDIVGAY